MANNEEEEKLPTSLWEIEGAVPEMIEKPERPDWIKAIGLILVDAFNLVVVTLAKALWQNVVVRFGQSLVVLIRKAEPIEDEAWNKFLKAMEDGGIMGRDMSRLLLRFRDLPLGVNSLFNMAILIGWLGNYIKEVGGVTLAPYLQDLNKNFSPQLPQPSNAMATGFMYPDLQKKVYDILRKHGYSDEHIEILYKSNMRMYDVGTVMMLFLRQEIDEADALDRLFKLGYDSDTAKELMKTWTIIPGPQDLLTMVAHEAFEPDMIERYGLGSEFPEEQSKWLAYQGLTRDWQERYWVSHWIHPSPGQILDMLHRQTKKPDGKPFDMEDVFEYYRLVEIPPYWRNMLADISYLPYTRVDTRRMHEMGVLSDEELVKAYMDQGYDRDHAEKMAEFTKRYNSEERVKMTRAQIIKAYRNTMLSRTEAKDLLRSIKMSEDIAEWFLITADFEEQLELQSLYIDAAKTRFISNLWDDPTTRAALMKLNLPGARIDALMEKWNSVKIAETKLPSKTDLDKFLKAGIIDKDSYRIEMYKLGYSFLYTDWYLKATEKTK